MTQEKVAALARKAGLTLTAATHGDIVYWTLANAQGYPRAVGSLECVARCHDLDRLTCPNGSET